MRAGAPLVSAAKAASDGRVLGIYAAAGGFVLQDDDAPMVHRCLTLVLNFDEQLRQRTLLLSIVSGLTHVLERHQVVALDHTRTQLDAFLEPYAVSVTNVVVVLPEPGPLPPLVVDRVLEQLRARANLQLQLVVGVAESPSAWAALTGISHFVEARSSGLLGASASVFRVLAATMAPKAALEVDAADLQQFLEDAKAPSFLVHAAWDPRSRELRLNGDTDESALRSAAASLLTMVGADIGVAALQEALRQWQAMCGPAAAVGASMPSRFFTPDHLELASR